MHLNFDSFKRCMAVSLAACALGLASGCAVSPDTRAHAMPGGVRLAPGEGVLSLTVSGNRLPESIFGKRRVLTVANLETKQSYSLTDRADATVAHSLFIANLPAGNYTVLDFARELNGLITLKDGAIPTIAVPTFSIAAGQLTDLGTMARIRHHSAEKLYGHTWGQVGTPLEREAVLRQLEPALGARLRAEPALDWEKNAWLVERQREYANLRGNSMQLLAPVRLADGTLLFGEAFGQIAVRHPQGTWKMVRTPVTQRLRAVHAEGDTVFAGTEIGLLLSGRLDGSGWAPIALPVADASVIHIGRLPGSEELLVVLQARDRYVGLSTSRSAPGQWTELFSRPRPLFSNFAFDTQGAVYQSGDTVVLASGSVESKQEMLAYDKGTRTWKLTAGGDSALPFGWASLHDGGVGRFRGIPLTGMYFAVTRDGGASWEKRGELNWANGALLFTSDQTGYVQRTDSTGAFDGAKSVMSVWRTDDAGRNWTRVGAPPVLWGKFVALGQPDQVGYAGADGKFYVSANGGKTWQLEHEVR